ncbi:hypothetical protein M9435_006086 [Picochlorum sp. BPE23]|nr:hypothetical protein M9435_006086 [Picochlorum sp. BPE23]
MVVSGMKLTFDRTRQQRRASSRPVMTVPCVAAAAAASFSEDDGRTEHVFAQALLLSFLACQNRSFFASKCFVECVIGMYKRGYSLDAMKRIVTFGTLSAGGMEQPMMQDIMLTWMTLVYLTLDEIGLVKDGKAAAAAAVQETDDDDGSEGMDSNTSSVMIRGLRDIAKTWIDQFKNGMTLRLLQLQQSMQGLSTADEEPGEFVRVMQQNSRLVLLALQVVRDSGETCEKISLDINHSDDDDSVMIESPLHYAMTGFIRGMMDMPADPLDGRVSSREEDLRETAVRLLLSFNGAVLGYLSPAQSFVSTAAYCYVSGWTADEVYMVLRSEEFEQSGGLVKVARPPGGTNASATLFARWISIVYMTMAKLGVMHPKASESQGWAWVGSADGQQEGGGGNLEALGVSDFITHTLRAASDTPVQETSVDGGFSFKFEDPDLMRQSGFALVLMQQISLVHMTKKLVENRLARENAGIV